MKLSAMLCIDFAFAAIVLTASSVGHSQVYKWVDENGTVNYGNKPPAATRGSKAPTVVEDRVSVYTPDATVAQATQNARDRSGLPNTGGALSSPAQQQPAARAFSGATPPPPPPTAYDPCANPNDVNCLGYPVHGGYARRHRPPNLVQPQLPPGAIAGNVNAGNGYIPGLSSQAQPPPTPAPSLMRRPDNRRDDDRGRGR